LADVYCVQTAGWMKTPLGTEVDLGPCHIVLEGVPAARERDTEAPLLFGPCLFWQWSPISATAEHLYELSATGTCYQQTHQTIHITANVLQNRCSTQLHCDRNLFIKQLGVLITK